MDWQIYNFNEIGLSLKYPKDWKVYEVGEGCGPIMGPPAKSNRSPNPVLAYPYIALCPIGDEHLEEAVQHYLSDNDNRSKLINSVAGEIDGHRFVKVRIDPQKSTSLPYAIFVDIQKQKPLHRPTLIIYAYYDATNYREFGAQKELPLDRFISTIDQIFTTFSFAQ